MAAARRSETARKIRVTIKTNHVSCYLYNFSRVAWPVTSCSKVSKNKARDNESDKEAILLRWSHQTKINTDKADFYPSLSPQASAGRAQLANQIKHKLGSELITTCNQGQARENMQPQPSSGKHATGAKRGKTCSWRQTPENVEPVPSAGKRPSGTTCRKMLVKKVTNGLWNQDIQIPFTWTNSHLVRYVLIAYQSAEPITRERACS